MTGAVVARKPQLHSCDPVWDTKWHEHTERCRDETIVPMARCIEAMLYPEESGCWRLFERREPEGTAWQCECGKTFVSHGNGPWEYPGYVSYETLWRPERWWEKRKRLKRERNENVDGK